jgi:UDP-glucose 4-epimerase
MTTASSTKEKVLITGGAGFIGSNLAQYLLDEGYAVAILDDFSAGKREYLPEGVTIFEGELNDMALLTRACERAVHVYHLAARPRVQDSIDHPFETHQVNVVGTLAVLSAAQRAGVRKVVFSSSSAVYGDTDVFPLQEETSALVPMSPYGVHKLTGEHLCRLWSLLYGLPTVSLRYFNVFGPHCDPRGSYPLVISVFLDKRQHGLPLTIAGDGTNTRDYVHVHDVARANLLAARSETACAGEVINIGSGTETSVREIAELVGGPVEYGAPRIEPTRSLASTARAKELLGWEPTISIAEGIQTLKREYVGE